MAEAVKEHHKINLLNLYLRTFDLFLDYFLLGFTKITNKSIIILKNLIKKTKSLKEINIYHENFGNIDVFHDRLESLGFKAIVKNY